MESRQGARLVLQAADHSYFYGWPGTIPPPRHRLVFFAGCMQNSHICKQLIASCRNDTYMDTFSNELQSAQ
ncbi:hypothetical protein L1049_008198 [Liquidambar formosana]|uniref:Uncharacterized protein n=1 Tax=Liquidambar formosana TaxID=63359 RepID=A0AAP0X904_LIQFO